MRLKEIPKLKKYQLPLIYSYLEVVNATIIIKTNMSRFYHTDKYLIKTQYKPNSLLV